MNEKKKKVIFLKLFKLNTAMTDSYIYIKIFKFTLTICAKTNFIPKTKTFLF